MEITEWSVSVVVGSSVRRSAEGVGERGFRDGGRWELCVAAVGRLDVCWFGVFRVTGGWLTWLWVACIVSWQLRLMGWAAVWSNVGRICGLVLESFLFLNVE